MGFVNIFVSKPCKISAKQNSLILHGDIQRKFNLQDINSIMIESRECNITTHALSSLAVSNIVVYICDEKHLPAAVFLPFNSYCRQSDMHRLQEGMSKPTQKKIWQSIVQNKIYNQARCLDLLGNIGANELESIASKVYSGDSTNEEAHAAQIYFRRMFGNDFSRNQDSVINASLNYTYSIVRGLIARSIVTYGFVPYLGLHHNSTLNNYNLADDIIEPFRAICDYFALCNIHDEETLTTQLKAKLYSIVNVDVEICGERHSLSNAVDKMIISLKSSIANDDVGIDMPKLIGAEMHRYE